MKEHILHRKLFTWSNNERNNQIWQTIPFKKASALVPGWYPVLIPDLFIIFLVADVLFWKTDLTHSIWYNKADPYVIFGQYDSCLWIRFTYIITAMTCWVASLFTIWEHVSTSEITKPPFLEIWTTGWQNNLFTLQLLNIFPLPSKLSNSPFFHVYVLG